MQKRFHSTSTQSFHSPLGKRLRQYWQTLLGFMVQRSCDAPQFSANPFQRRYAAKARFYSYLPPSEEQRDWLEQIYHQS
ncbi:MAG: hypothetical protein O3A14_13635 [Cyanobacteria bacterium]|nr:hypothetical protein [Cyanobacteriota bacterium]